MHARGGEAEQDVSGCDVTAGQQPVALDGTDCETGKIVVPFGVKSRHFGGLAADQRAAGLPAAFGDAANDVLPDRRVDPTGRVVVEEEQRFGALDDEIVDAHRHQVDADRVVDAGVDCDLELGADAIIGRHQQRVVEARGLQIEDAAEATDFGVGARARRGTHQRLDRLDEGIAAADVDAGLGIGTCAAARRAVSAHMGLPRRRPFNQSVRQRQGARPRLSPDNCPVSGS